MIPKIIHYVWLGKKEKPKLFYKCLDSWKKFCPDYEIKEWNEDNFDFSDNKFAMQAYSLKKYGYVADYIRVKVLNEFGGIYLDTDVEIIKSFDQLLKNDFFLPGLVRGLGKLCLFHWFALPLFLRDGPPPRVLPRSVILILTRGEIVYAAPAAGKVCAAGASAGIGKIVQNFTKGRKSY